MTDAATTRRPRRQAGQTTVEWVLLMVAFGLPMVYVFRLLLSLMAEHYRLVTFIEALPFP